MEWRRQGREDRRSGIGLKTGEEAPVLEAGVRRTGQWWDRRWVDMQAGSKKDRIESDRGVKERMGVTLMQNRLGGPGVGAGGRKAGHWSDNRCKDRGKHN